MGDMLISCRQSHVGFSDRALYPWVRHFTLITSSYRRRCLSGEFAIMGIARLMHLNLLKLKTAKVQLVLLGNRGNLMTD